jgi:hypothetical protein
MLRVGVAFPCHLFALRHHCFGLVPIFWDSYLYTRDAFHLVEYFVASSLLSEAAGISAATTIASGHIVPIGI